MAVAFGNATESVRTNTADPYNFTHAPTGTPRGVVVTIVHGTESTDLVTGVTYGGVAMTRVTTAADTATEAGRAYLYFLGSGIPTGDQIVSVELASATGTDVHVVCSTVTADTDTGIVDLGQINNNVANPSVTLNYAGLTSLAFAALYGGGAAPSSFTPNANCETLHDHDFGNFYAEVIRQTTPGSTNFAIGGTASSDDVAYVAAAVTEVTSVTVTATVAPATAAPATPEGADITVGPPTASSTAAVSAPVVGNPSLVESPAAEATAGIGDTTPAVTVATGASEATASAVSQVPAITVSSVASATASVSGPSLVDSGALEVPAAEATAGVATPEGIDITVGPSPSAATASVVGPTLDQDDSGNTIEALAAEANASVATPEGLDVTIGPSTAAASASVGTPVLLGASGEEAIVSPLPATAFAVAQEEDPFPWLESGAPPIPILSVQAVASATAAAPTPTPDLRVQLSPAESTASTTSPGRSASITATVAEATAEVSAPLAPGPDGDILIVHVSTEAVASVEAPTPALSLTSPVAESSAATSTLVPSLVVTSVAAEATAGVASPIPGVTVTEVAAEATAAAQGPGIIKLGSVFLEPSAALATASVRGPRPRDGSAPVLTILDEDGNQLFSASAEDGSLNLMVSSTDSLTLQVLEEDSE